MAEMERSLPAWVGAARLGVGLAQGVGLYFLFKDEQLFGPAWHAAALFSVLLVPVLIVGGLGALRWPTLAAWTIVAVAMAAGMAWYDIDRRGDNPLPSFGPSPIVLVLPALLFVGHHLIAAGDEARRWIAPYERYFDLGWRHGAQLLLALLFTGAFWLVYWLGAALFELINIHFLSDLMREQWFVFPATSVVFAAAIHVTDVRSGLVRGVRALGLILLSWLLPVMAGLGVAFLIALCFTGLQPLWDTRAATAILLSSAGALVILINATYQDGPEQHPPPFLLYWSARIAAVLMTPLAALAGYALFVRIAQYGLTPERIVAAAVLTIGACYAIAYAVGAFWPRWMKPLEIGNIVSAFVVLIVGLALFSPIADPARLSVDDQMGRLASGRASAQDFDVAFLRRDGGRYGQAALLQLKAGRATEAARALSDRATLALGANTRWDAGLNPAIETPMPASRITMHPAGAVLPEGFVASGPAVTCRARGCEGFLVDVTGDGRAELALAGDFGFLAIYQEGEAQRWRELGAGQFQGGPIALRSAFQRGDIHAAPAAISDLVIGGERMRIMATTPTGVISVQSSGETDAAAAPATPPDAEH